MNAPEHAPDQPADGGTDAPEMPGMPGMPETPDAPEAAGPAAPARPSWRAVGAWLLLAGAAVALDGLVGGLALVFVAAVLLAGLSPRVLGAVGVLLLVAAPVALLVQGLPSDRSVSPAFVSDSLLPHHLTFSGLILVSAFALIDLGPHLRSWAAGEHPTQEDGPPFGTVAGVVVVALVAVGALLACRAVLAA